jgi:hypothetical protein
MMRAVSLLSLPAVLMTLGAGVAQAAPWLPCGQLSGINPLTCQIGGRPSTGWEYAIAYNTNEPLPVVCTFWNLGARIANKEPYLIHSDNPAAGMSWGGFVFYQNTAAPDDDICAGGYRHRYWALSANNAITTGFSNGCLSAEQVFCRRR